MVVVLSADEVTVDVETLSAVDWIDAKIDEAAAS